MKLYLPTTIATLMLLGMPSSSTAQEFDPRLLGHKQKQKQLRGVLYTDPQLKFKNHGSRETDYATINNDAVQSNINSFAATTSGSEYDIRNAFCYTWGGQPASPVGPALHTRQPTNDCPKHCNDLQWCTGWEWRQNRDECFFFDTPNGGNFLPSSGSEICAWRV